MAENLSQPSYEKEIDLREIINIFIESKKFIMSTILIFTIASIIYSLLVKPTFKTSAQMEIGYFELDNGDRNLIESPSDLISDLRILILKNPGNKFSQKVSMNPLESKAINLETTSSSAEQNESLLTELINYIDKRHSNLSTLITDQKKDEIIHKINLIESEVSFIKSKILNENQFKKLVNKNNLTKVKSDIKIFKENLRLDLEAEISKINNVLPIIDLEISQLNQLIIEDSNNLKLLKDSTLYLERASKTPTLQQTIATYKLQINQLTRDRKNKILDISILSQKLDALKKNTLKSEVLLKLEEELITLENQLTILESDTLQPDQLFSLEQEQKTLENEFQTLISQIPVKTRPIGDIQTDTIKPKPQLVIFLGIILGFFTSILLVFIRNFVKSYKESQA